MSKEVKKITQEELEKVQQNQNDLQKRLANIGFLEVQKANDVSQIAMLEKEMGEIKQELQEKYGDVNINIQTGEYADIPKEEVAKLKKAE
tara:strand:+ start:1459 stop:1728 length:270 start_codon:yes stop_codon:yes gene_type:complete